MKKWEKKVPMGKDKVMYGLIEEEESTPRGTIYAVKGYEIFPDGSRDVDLLSGYWHDSLQGAKKLFDMEYDIDPNNKHKWKQIKIE